jgi:transcriptional regulator with XRE-family HTH domain
MACDIDLQLGKRLRRRRQMLGLTQQDVAGMMGISCQQIQKYECGADRISAASLWRLCAALETSVDYFYEGLGCGAEGAPAPAIAQTGAADGAELLGLVALYNRLPDRHRRKVFATARAMMQAAALAQ